MALLSLPPELIYHIASFVPVRQLPAVACACSTLCAVARRRLYRHLSVSPALHNLSVVITLARNRVLAKHVRSFCVNVQPAVSPFKAFYRLLAQALHAMTDVVQLHVFIGHEASWVLPSSFQLAYPQLLNFACSFPFNSHVAHFLQLTPSLLELEVAADYPCPESETLPSLPPTAIPHLVQFAGPSGVGQAIVPGRPVNSIFLRSGDLNEPAMDSLIQSTAQISALCGMTSQPPVSVLECLSHRMPQLTYLRLMTTFEFPEAPDIVSSTSSTLLFG
jgi:hypothetical protein